VLIAVLGATFGLAIGVLFGWLVVTALAGQGITELGLPAGQLIASVILAALAGVVAAILPARRAARTEILRAIAAE
jgi:putative ABC transport system permease protein